MNSKGLLDHKSELKRVTFKDLKDELDSINKDVCTIQNMQTSEESKQPILAELQTQINEVKEKMHDYIDSL